MSQTLLTNGSSVFIHDTTTNRIYSTKRPTPSQFITDKILFTATEARVETLKQMGTFQPFTFAK